MAKRNPRFRRSLTYSASHLPMNHEPRTCLSLRAAERLTAAWNCTFWVRETTIQSFVAASTSIYASGSPAKHSVFRSVSNLLVEFTASPQCKKGYILANMTEPEYLYQQSFSFPIQTTPDYPFTCLLYREYCSILDVPFFKGKKRSRLLP